MARLKGSKDLKPRKKGGGRKPGGGQARAEARAAGTASNSGMNEEILIEAIKAHERQDELLASYQGEYMNRCKGPRGTQKDWEKRVKDAGIPVRAYRAELKRRAYERKAMAVRAKLEPDDQALLDMVRAVTRKKLGAYADSPLGEAAVHAAVKEAAEKGSAAMTAMAAGGDLSPAEVLEAGLKQLDPPEETGDENRQDEAA